MQPQLEISLRCPVDWKKHSEDICFKKTFLNTCSFILSVLSFVLYLSLSLLFFFFFFCHTCRIWKSQSQRLNPSHTYNLCKSCDNARSLTGCTTAGTPTFFFQIEVQLICNVQQSVQQNDSHTHTHILLQIIVCYRLLQDIENRSLGLPPCLDYCKQCSYEHWGACIFSNQIFHLFWIYAREWGC